MPPFKMLRYRKCGVLPEKSIYAVEMRLKSILEAVAERIGCFEAHRSSWPNGNLEEAPPNPGSHYLSTGSVDVSIAIQLRISQNI